MDASGAVIRLRDEIFGKEESGGDFIGIQRIGPDLLSRLPLQGCLVADAYLPALRSGFRLDTFLAPARWDDIGSIPGYVRANERWLAANTLESFQSPSAIVSPAVDIKRSIIGARATVDRQGKLRRSIIWPEAKATAPLKDAIVTPSLQLSKSKSKSKSRSRSKYSGAR